ncbi:MAG: DNA alkylation repair protein [Acidobacteriota bacterium]|nr:DNA alkylation repair protein [Acidobacteriota bacterium]
MLAYLEPLAREFKNHADPVKARQMKAYMKNRFEYFGFNAPIRKAILKKFVVAQGKPKYRIIDVIVSELFQLPQREFQYAAIEFCGMIKRDWSEDSLELFEKIATTKSWWDSVDSVNSVCIRPFFLKFPKNCAKHTLRWIESENIWLQRLSIIFQLRYKEKTDTALLARNIGLLNQSDEFFVQKAIGWALRDYGHSNPDWVIDFVDKTELKPLSRREALKKLKETETRVDR